MIGFMQGRLCALIDGKIQAFPWQDWRAEFHSAAQIDMHIMEWTLDQERLYENPLMTDVGRSDIKALSTQFDIHIPSVTGDCFMQAPFWKAGKQASKALENDFWAVCKSCSSVGVKRIVVPLVDNGRLESQSQEARLVECLLAASDFLASLDIQIVFETDYDPANVKRFIDMLPKRQFGINYDIGNSAALGFDPAEELDTYGARVLNVHVKDRVFGGTTVPLTEGDADFPLVFCKLAEIGYDGEYILQTARATDGDHIGVAARYRDMVVDWVSFARDGLLI